jgi:diaminopimelate epimerase
MPDRLPFTKMQGVGNDFVVVDGRHAGDTDWSVLAMEICDRRTGVGADGLLVLDDTHSADIMMRMYNPDGTPDVCGNGLRCIARYAVEHGVVDGETLRIATLAGVRAAQMHRNDAGDIAAVTVNMGVPRFDPPSIPMRVPLERVMDYALELDDGQCLTLTALSTGSTHAVTFVETLPEDDFFFSVSPQVEEHPLFPTRTSLMWCQVEAPSRLRLRIWERGAGETWGCGTGACAAAVAAVLHAYAVPNEPILVRSHGGELIVRWAPGGSIEMTGPAETIYTGAYDLDPGRSTALFPV